MPKIENKITLCHVCGMESDPLQSVSFEGERYHFCSAECKEEFNKNPLEYSS